MADFFQTASGLLTAANPVVGGIASVAGSLTQGGLFGGGADDATPTKSTATGTFSGGGLTITQEDSTLKIGLIVAGVIVALAIWQRARR